MSVALTEAAVLDRSKTVTRRVGWTFAKPGDRLTLCRKVMGRRKGEPLVRLAEVAIVSVRREPLRDVTHEDVAREGFPGWTPEEFVAFFCRHMDGGPGQIVTRLEWRYVGEEPMRGKRTTGKDGGIEVDVIHWPDGKMTVDEVRYGLCDYPLLDGRYCTSRPGHDGAHP